MAVDIGTSSVRAAMFDEKGKQLGIASLEYPLICSEAGMAELDPELVFSSILKVVKGCVDKAGVSASDIGAMGFSTQMHSFLAVDKEGKCLTNVMTWADNRPIRQAEYIAKNYDCMKLYSATGCRVHHPMYPLSKILWIKEEKPEIFNKVYKFISIKTYVFFKLFSQFVTDYTDASASACFNIHTFKWDSDILDNVLGISENMLGEPVECTHVLKGMKKEYAGLMGINSDMPVVAGSGDGIMANLGCGVFDDTSMSCTVGTSGALRIAVDKPLIDPQQRTWCYCFTRDTWVAGGAINNGGIVLKWIRDNYKAQFDEDMKQQGISNYYKLFDKFAAEVDPGSDGLLFLPLLTGERSPNWNAAARGIMYGLDIRHGRKHFIRASMEGVIYRLFSVYEAITAINSNVRQIKANGGYAKSDIWLQMQADIFNKEIAVAGIDEASVFGAAYNAMAAVGAVNSLKSGISVMEPSRVIKPNPENTEMYREQFRLFKDIYNKIYK